MGIRKIKSKQPGIDNHAQRGKCLLSQIELANEVLLENSPLNDPSNCKLGEVGCDCIVVEDQMCHVPYELYDLPDLNRILSLETWSSCLTEDERFSLAAFLPDIDQETFWLTIKELLGGDAMFFGSPIKNFFNRMKSGFCSPEITRLRDGLQFLQRREYYHFLRQYHDNMIDKFADMKNEWNRCQASVGAEERIQIWKNMQNDKPVFLVDLNAYPDEDISSKGDRNVDTVPLLKKTKYVNDSHDATNPLNGLALKTHTKGKGVLKIKPIQNHTVQALPNKSGELSMRLPKGVLKIKPKNDLERQGMSSEQISSDLLGSYPPGASHPRLAFKRPEHNYGVKSAFLHQTGSDGSTYGNQKLVEGHETEDLFSAGFGSSQVSQSIQRKKNMLSGMRLQDSVQISEDIFPSKSSQNLRIYSREDCWSGDRHKEKNIWQDTKLHRNRLYENSVVSKVGSFQFSQESRQERRVKTSKAGPRDYFEEDHEDEIDDDLEVPSLHMSVSGVGKGLMLPITYKRKKPHRKLIQVDSPREQSDLVNFAPTLPSETINIKPKAIKIKFKGLTG